MPRHIPGLKALQKRVTERLEAAKEKLANAKGNDTQKLWDGIVSHFPNGIDGLAGVIVEGATGPTATAFNKQQVLKLITTLGISRTAAQEKAGRVEDDIDEEDIIAVLKYKVLHDILPEDDGEDETTTAGPVGATRNGEV